MTAFRNVDLDVDASVSTWPAEAIEIALDRGSLTEWRRLAAEIRRSPWGAVARTVADIVAWGEHDGVDRLMERVIERARSDVVVTGRARWARWLQDLRGATGLSMREFAALAGTSASRLSDYENGRVSPTTDALARLEHAARISRRSQRRPRRGPRR